MASEGPNSPDSGADDASIGTRTWSNPGNIVGSGGGVASCGFTTSGQASHYLVGTDFDFAIPAGSTIDGILVEWRRRVASLGGLNDAQVRIVKGGVIGSTNKSAGAALTNTLEYGSFGGASDLWGETWSVDDINATTFGSAYGASSAVSASRTCEADHVRITVYYTAPSATGLFSAGWATSTNVFMGGGR